jgi:hypothetical protein
MKGRIFVVVILVAAAALAGRWVNRAVGPRAAAGTREETRQTFRLDAGADVEVSAINGKVEVRTGEGDTAEVHIVRTADSPEALEYNRVSVEGSSSSLVVRGVRGSDGFWRWLSGGGGGARQEVTLTLPRRVEFSATHVNGALSVGKVDGSVEVAHVNGRVEVAQSLGRSEVSHVNGAVRVGVSRLGADGMDVSHVNGNVEIRFRQSVNADVEVERQHGALSANVPNVTMQERLSRSHARLRFGTGGAPVQISHVNGNVRFESDAPAAGAAQTVSTVILGDDLPDDVPPPPVPPLAPLPPAPPAP